MKRLLIITAMTFVLSVSTLAGDIPCGAPSPAPPGPTQTTNATSSGEIPCGFAEQISEEALSGLLAVFGLLVV
ncbi:MAG TPA: hypothetical protein VMZ30_18455 [Pyrinomonadaceae bacterium]|nr:hypothetical protein [Pyrinomonadaceae bacterium]